MTSLLRKSAVATAGAAMVGFALAAMASPIGAQETPAARAKAKAPRKAAAAEPEAEPKAKSSRDVPHRVPTYFGGLGLSADQRESIYAIEAEYQSQIKDLEQRADALRERLMAECEDVLTAPQKKALTAARESAAARRKAAAEPEPEPDAPADADADDDPAPAPKSKAAPRAPVTLD